MPPRPLEDDGSDSDDDALSDIESTVLLGVPDGAIDAISDRQDVAVSRIGGQPALLSAKVPFESSQCKNCRDPMELLVQMWCPLEDSPYDRALYIWGCASSACQRQAGCVRAWRGLRYNQEYAAKLKKKRTLGPTSDAQKDSASKNTQGESKTNPFALSTKAPQTGTGIGTELFSAVASSPKTVTACNTAEDEDGEGSDNETASSEASIVVALASATLSDSPWSTAPCYPPLYLSTVPEYIRPDKASKKPAPEDHFDDPETGGSAWTSEKYENSLETDLVFDKFSRRVSCEAEQCVRYELGGTPLPFANDDVFKRLFPIRTSATTIVTGGVFSHSPSVTGRRSYDLGTVPACPACHGARVFECQLMPNLINIVSKSADKAPGKRSELPDEERRRAVERILKGNKDGVRGMEWGTIMVFSCKQDCCAGDDGWHEEFVSVQWDT